MPVSLLPYYNSQFFFPAAFYVERCRMPQHNHRLSHLHNFLYFTNKINNKNLRKETGAVTKAITIAW